MLSSQSDTAFPGGPQGDTYEPIKDVLLYAMEANKNTEQAPAMQGVEMSSSIPDFYRL